MCQHCRVVAEKPMVVDGQQVMVKVCEAPAVKPARELVHGGFEHRHGNLDVIEHSFGIEVADD